VSKRDEVPTVLKEGEQPSVRPLYSLNVDGPKKIKGAVDHWSKVLKEDHGFTLNQAKHVAFHTPNPKVLKALAEHYDVTEKLSWLPNTVANLDPASCVTNLYYRLYKSGIVTNDGDVSMDLLLVLHLVSLMVYTFSQQETRRRHWQLRQVKQY
jgi:3-oxoacyl-[acyl-carrier-protein] synthase III